MDDIHSSQTSSLNKTSGLSPLLEVGLFERPSGLLDYLDVVEVTGALESEHGVHGELGESVLLVRQQLRAQGRPERASKKGGIEKRDQPLFLQPQPSFGVNLRMILGQIVGYFQQVSTSIGKKTTWKQLPGYVLYVPTTNYASCDFDRSSSG